MRLRTRSCAQRPYLAVVFARSLSRRFRRSRALRLTLTRSCCPITVAAYTLPPPSAQAKTHPRLHFRPLSPIQKRTKGQTLYILDKDNTSTHSRFPKHVSIQWNPVSLALKTHFHCMETCFQRPTGACRPREPLIHPPFATSRITVAAANVPAARVQGAYEPIGLRTRPRPARKSSGPGSGVSSGSSCGGSVEKTART